MDLMKNAIANRLRITKRITFVDHPRNGFCEANETNNVNEAFDKSVYKLTSRQLFRHVLSDKIYIHGSRVEDKHGDISHNSNPSDHIIHVRGNELVIDESMWREVFPIHLRFAVRTSLRESKVHYVDDTQFANANTFMNEFPEGSLRSKSRFDVSPCNETHEFDSQSELSKANDELDLTIQSAIDSLSSSDICIDKELLDAIINGFDKNITIHCTTTDKVINEVSIYPLITALNACVSEYISQEYVDDCIEKIRSQCTLTANASSRWYEILFANRNRKAQHPGALFTILKKYNSTYYSTVIKPMIDKQFGYVSPKAFETERYTINDYKNEFVKFKNYDDFVNNLIKCIAFIDDGRFIIKYRDDVISKQSYRILDLKQLKEVLKFIGKYPVECELTESVIANLKRNHKKIPSGESFTKYKQFKPMNELFKVEVQSKFMRYSSTALLSNCDKVFNLFRAPVPSDYYTPIINDRSLVDRFLELINDQLYDDESRVSFNHFINTNAYLLQQRKKSNVFFIKFSETGNTGKNYIDNAFKNLYGEYALTGITEQQITEKYNGGFANKLYRSYDEFETSNYKTRSINNILKRITNDKVATRAMNSDTKQTDDYAIDVLNTNDPSCYGITKGDRATISRLCIIRLKERDIRKSEFKKYIDVIDNPNFAYSLYDYLMSIDISEFINNKSFNRYPIDRTQSIIKQLNSLKSNTLDEFIDSIYNEFELKVYKKENVDVIKVSDLNRLYKSFMNDRRYILSTSLRDELEKRGIHYIKRMKFRGIAQEVYFRKHVDEDIEYEKFDDDDDDSPL